MTNIFSNVGQAVQHKPAILREIQLFNTTANAEYARGYLVYKNETVPFIWFDVSEGLAKQYNNQIAYISGSVEKNNNQTIIFKIKKVEPNDNLDIMQVLPASPFNKKQLENNINSYIKQIKDDTYHYIVNTIYHNILNDKNIQQFVTNFPLNNHGSYNYIGGLLTHIIRTTQQAIRQAKSLPSQHLDINLIIAGGLLTNLGTVYCYNNPTDMQNTLAGNLIGNGAIVDGLIVDTVTKKFSYSYVIQNFKINLLRNAILYQFDKQIKSMTNEATILRQCNFADLENEKIYNQQVLLEQTTDIFSQPMNDLHFKKIILSK